MKEGIERIIEKAKANQNVLKKLKSLATDAQEYELAAQLRSMEKENFPNESKYVESDNTVKLTKKQFRRVRKADKKLNAYSYAFEKAMEKFGREKDLYWVEIASLDPRFEGKNLTLTRRNRTIRIN